jgi:hypothetical protein
MGCSNLVENWREFDSTPFSKSVLTTASATHTKKTYFTSARRTHHLECPVSDVFYASIWHIIWGAFWVGLCTIVLYFPWALYQATKVHPLTLSELWLLPYVKPIFFSVFLTCSYLVGLDRSVFHCMRKQFEKSGEGTFFRDIERNFLNKNDDRGLLRKVNYDRAGRSGSGSGFAIGRSNLLKLILTSSPKR